MIVETACSGAEFDHSQYCHIDEPRIQAFVGPVSSQSCMIQIPTYQSICAYQSNQPIGPGQDRLLLELLHAPGGRLNKKDGLTRYGNSHVKDKTS